MNKTTAKSPSPKKKRPAKSTAEPRLSRQRKPTDLPVDDWQRALRRQFGREQSFRIENLGDEPIFSEFAITNPETARSYRVAIRSDRTGENFCCGVGLNLQHAAAIVVNMDMPWNPAVLEQRIGRVHRMGQARGVQVINFVAKGTIEEGMLSLLAFKKSLFAGVLDGGHSEVILQGTRLSKFMESVEQVTGSAGVMEGEASVEEESVGDLSLDTVADIQDSESSEMAAGAASMVVQGANEASESHAAESPIAIVAKLPAEVTKSARIADPWTPLLTAGVQFLDELAAATKGGAQSPWVETDPKTGKRYLKLPMPQPEAVERLAEGLLKFLGSRQ
jgi:Helicase conserved C-terminal domain